MSPAAMDDRRRNFYEFDPFLIDVSRRLLLREGAPVRLTPKAFETLLALVRGGGRVMSKGELMSAVWPDSFVEEGNLAQNVFLLRRALGEGKGEHRYIVTVPGAGYLFAPRVRESDAPPAAGRTRKADAGTINSVAVLPFRPLAGGEDGEALGLGLADALITRLSGVSGVRVLPTSAVLRLCDDARGTRLAGDELGADAVVEGFYQRDGGRLRVSVQLVRARDGVALWAARFDGEFEDLFAAQDSVSEQAALALGPELCGAARLRPPRAQNRRRAVSPRAPVLRFRRGGLRGV
ncbi:MAG TPA: winged helix-turn-helix domain-containing protein [Pyrinomonadaceae bacterium]|nr:winged helix-turn-helix domain-containing protein [Pyrinomonadaceae bacterium]